jgi:glycerate 2-kinase
VIAAGKAAPAMASAFLAEGFRVQTALAVGTHPSPQMPAALDFMTAGHPYPDARSVAAASEILTRAGRVAPGEILVVLLSGGASALVARPAEGLAMEEKEAATRALMLAGADVVQLNTVRKHLSSIKGGWLAASCRGEAMTLAISDVPGDDIGAIGSGLAMPDTSTWTDVHAALVATGVWPELPSRVRARVEDGVAGRVHETPKPGDERLARARGVVIGTAADAVRAAQHAAEVLGYAAIVVPGRVSGEARETAPEWLASAVRRADEIGGRVCVISAGETTVKVRGDGLGGRNLEFVLSLVEPLAALGRGLVASVGTDGIDGPTDVAGAWADAGTAGRAAARGLPPPTDVLDRNDSFNYFSPLGDTIRTGRTDTNVGDLQVMVLAPQFP